MKKQLMIGIATISLLFAGCGQETPPEEVIAVTEMPTESVVEEEALTESESVSEKTEKEEIENTEIGEYPENQAYQDSSITEVYQEYAEYFKNYPLEEGGTVGNYTMLSGPVVYRFDYITDDDIPDLIYGGTEAVHASNIYILTSQESDHNPGSVRRIGPLGSYNTVCYYPGKGIIRTNDSGMGVEGTYYSMVNSDDAERFAYEEHYMDDNYENELESHYYIGEGNEVSEEEYKSYLQEVIGEDEPVVFSTWENTEGYDVLDAEAVENAFRK